MDDNIFQIGAEGPDVERIMNGIRQTVSRKMDEGVYTDADVARAERNNLHNIKDQEGFMAFYLDCLHDAVFVDINDFEIHERRSRFSGLLVKLKKTIWKLLKFYTYRLWSQQNQVNGLLLAATESIEERASERSQALEARIAALESGKQGTRRGEGPASQ